MKLLKDFENHQYMHRKYQLKCLGLQEKYPFRDTVLLNYGASTCKCGLHMFLSRIYVSAVVLRVWVFSHPETEFLVKICLFLDLIEWSTIYILLFRNKTKE